MSRSRDRRILIAPLLILVAGFCGGCVVIAYDILIDVHGYSAKYQDPYMVWTEALVAAEMLVTWVVTGLIIGKLWWVGRRSKAAAQPGGPPVNRYRSIIIALVESGALYSVTMLIFLILWIPKWVSEDTLDWHPQLT